MRTPPKRAPYRSREAGTVRDLSAGCGRPDTRQLGDCITLIERFEENAPSRLLARHPGCAGCRCRTPNWAFCARHLRPGIQDRGALLMVMEDGACAHRGRRLLSAGGGSGAGYRAAGRVARCRTKCPASAPAPVITPTAVTARAHPYLPARPGQCAAVQDAVDDGQRHGDGREPAIKSGWTLRPGRWGTPGSVRSAADLWLRFAGGVVVPFFRRRCSRGGA